MKNNLVVQRPACTDSYSPLSPDLPPGSDAQLPGVASCLENHPHASGSPPPLRCLGQTFLIAFTAALGSLADSLEKEKSPLDVGPKQGAGRRLARDNWAVVWVLGNGLFGNISRGRRHLAGLGMQSH